MNDLPSDCAKVTLIPLREAHRRYEVIDDFLRDLAAFAKGEDDRLLKMLEGAPTPAQVFDDIVRISFSPIPGVAVNLNNAVKQLRDWWKRRKKKEMRLRGRHERTLRTLVK